MALLLIQQGKAVFTWATCPSAGSGLAEGRAADFHVLILHPAPLLDYLSVIVSSSVYRGPYVRSCRPQELTSSLFPFWLGSLHVCLSPMNFPCHAEEEWRHWSPCQVPLSDRRFHLGVTADIGSLGLAFVVPRHISTTFTLF